MTDREQLEAFAEEVRIRANKIMARCLYNSPQSVQKAAELCAELSTLAAGVKNGLQMQEEVAAGNYDLSRLPAPSGCEDME